MMITMTPIADPPKNLKKCKLYHKDREIGTVEPSLHEDGTVYYHACIRNNFRMLLSGGLMQGHGDTPEEAIQKAIKRGHKEALELWADAQALAKMLEVDLTVYKEADHV